MKIVQKSSHYSTGFFGWVFFIGMLITAGAIAQSPGAIGDIIAGEDAKQETIVLRAGQSKVVHSSWPTVRVSVTDPKIADVQVITNKQILLQGKSAGSTDLILWGEDEGKFWQAPVRVKADLGRLEDELEALFPDAALELISSKEVIIIKGLLRHTDQVIHLHNYLEASDIKYVDMTSVAGVQQVQIQVRMAEVTRSALKTLGINAFHTNNDFFGVSNIGSSSGGALNPFTQIGPAEGTIAGDNLDFTFNSDVLASPLVTVFGGFPGADLEFFIQAMSENQYLRVLANPTLVALSGEQAGFLAGGEFPIPVVQSGSGGTGSAITIEYREFGVNLKFLPTVLGDGTIRIHVAPEVSNLTNVGAVEIEGFRVPGVTTRKFETTVELKSGQTFAMAGLIQSSIDARDSRVPGLGDLPILGALFRSTRYEKSETELVVLVTASLVQPLNMGTTPPLPGFLHSAPNDWEFYAEGRISGKEPAQISAQDAAWLKNTGLDQLIGPGAWDEYGKDIIPSTAPMSADEAVVTNEIAPDPNSNENAAENDSVPPQMQVIE